MAIRRILTKEDETLYKKCKPVEKFDKKLFELLDDMAETLYKSNGVGLAAPQIGILRRIAVIDVGEGLVELINPEIISKTGKQRNVEGCLSCPNEWGYVTRPAKVKIKAQNRQGELVEYEGKELFAICASHEIDHLDGNLFLKLVEEFVEVGEESDKSDE
jgi:peptide deformylase